MLKALLVLASLVVALPAAAEDFPGSQPITIVVPFNPGGTTDLLARAMAEFLQKRMNHTVIVQNKAGAATEIGTDFVAKAPADGHTLLLAPHDMIVLAAVHKNLPYNVADMTYLNRFFVGEPLIVTGPNSGINTIEDLIAKIKANPGKLRNATNGVGSLDHLGALKFDAAIGGKSIHVPYSGQGPGSIDVLSGVVDYLNGASVPLAPGLKVLAPVGSARHPDYPDLKTLGELGYKDAEWEAWFALVGPPKMPNDITDELNKQIDGVLSDPGFVKEVVTATHIAPPKNPLTGDAFRKSAMEEFDEWAKIVERENLVIK